MGKYGDVERRGVLSQKLLPVLRERFPDRGLVEGNPPDSCAVFPGLHPGIRGVSIYDDGYELTLCVDDLTHGHFSEYTEGLLEAEREQHIVERVVEFLEALFADKVVVWGQQHMGGWYRGQQYRDLDRGHRRRGSCPGVRVVRTVHRHAKPDAAADG